MSSSRKAPRKTSSFDLSRVLEGLEGLALPKAITAVVDAFHAGSPTSTEPLSANPLERARELTHAASLKAAAISGSLSLPPGPLGVLTAVPELLAVWNLQAQLVADIAAAFGQKPPVKQEEMVYCLFRNMACQAARDVVVRLAERAIVRRASMSLLGRAAWRIGVPIIGAAGAAAYSWFDTRQVAKRAIAIFQEEAGRGAEQSRQDEDGTVRKPAAKRRSPARKKSEKIIAFPAEGTRNTKSPRKRSKATLKTENKRATARPRRTTVREVAPAA